MYNKKIKLNILIQHVLLFFLIFGFPIIMFINSVKVVVGITILFLILGISAPGFYRKFFSIEFSIFNFLYFIFFLYTLVLTVISKNLDFSLAIKILSSHILILITMLFMSFLNINIEESIWKCFIVQSLIMLLCTFSQNFYDLTSPFRSEMAEHHLLAYGRMRGNAISGYQFFGISSMYGFVIIWGILNFKKSLQFVFQFLLIVVCGLLSGRFCITAVMIGGLIKFFFLLKKKQYKYFVYISLGITIFIFLSVFAVFRISNIIQDPVLKKTFDNYIVQPIESIVIKRKFETSSTNSLIEMYQFDLTEYLFKAEGKYLNDDSSYFGGVDIGYYRVILYYGIQGIFILSLLFLFFIWFSSKKADISLKIGFFLFFLILNAKGDVQLYSNNIIPLLVGYCYFAKKFLPQRTNDKKKNILIKYNNFMDSL